MTCLNANCMLLQCVNSGTCKRCKKKVFLQSSFFKEKKIHFFLQIYIFHINIYLILINNIYIYIILLYIVFLHKISQCCELKYIPTFHNLIIHNNLEHVAWRTVMHKNITVMQSPKWKQMMLQHINISCSLYCLISRKEIQACPVNVTTECPHHHTSRMFYCLNCIFRVIQ